MNRPLLNPQQQQALQAFGASNPFHAGAFNPMAPHAGAVTTTCATDRVMLAGGQLMSYLTPTSIVPLESVFRRLPVDGIFTATPSTPCAFEMGAITVPPRQGFLVLDWRFSIYRPSGSAAGEFVELEENRLSTQVGWNIQADAQRQGQYGYQLNPVPPANASSPAYQSNPNPGFIPGGPPSPATDDQFTQARYTIAQSAVGDALSLMPQRHHRQGLLQVPAPWVLHSSQTFVMSCRVFRAVPIPIAFFESEVFGIMMPDSDLIEMQKALAPCITAPGGV